ncbi:glycosyltransferase [Caenimonas sp. SL110]|uniref:glycosyltransferase n=1 Tax=Caenimonas sp. SL110 TaxID=1450524 RepID=UPI0006539E2A|nr:glycosyltransferase [Caenimonas sp. SL110]
MKIAFVVLTYNRPDALLAVLRALAPQCPSDAVVIIADDGSRADAVAAMRQGLPKFACPVRHVWHPDIGFTASRARNLGAFDSHADYVVFLDGDCVPSPHFVRAHIALAQPGYFVNGNRVLLSPDMTRRVSATDAPEHIGMLEWLRLRMAGDVNKLTHLVYWAGAPGRVESTFRWKSIRSCNFGVWYRDFELVNGFDETFHGWGHEDADLVLRLHHLGLSRKNGFLATEVLHLWHDESSRDSEELNRERVLQRMKGNLVRAQKGLAELASDPAPTVTTLN